MRGIRGRGSWLPLLLAVLCSGLVVVACGKSGRSFDEVLNAIKSQGTDDAVKVLDDAELTTDERLAIDALCTSVDSYSDEGQAPGVLDLTGLYRRSVNPGGVGTYTESADRLDTTLSLTSVNPQTGLRYFQFCVAR